MERSNKSKVDKNKSKALKRNGRAKVPVGVFYGEEVKVVIYAKDGETPTDAIKRVALKHRVKVKDVKIFKDETTSKADAN